MAPVDCFEVPFPTTAALNSERLRIPHWPTLQARDSTSASLSSLDDSDQLLPHVPGEPTVSLSQNEVHHFLARELDTPILDELHTRLWLVARQSGKSIDALNRQRVKGREIVSMEDPKLHLVWHRDKIYLKPIPLCLFNHHFWRAYLPSSVDSASSGGQVPQTNPKDSPPVFDPLIVVGFLRSYAFLVQHRLDFALAQKHHLIPKDIDWTRWSIFIAHFRRIEDDRVAKRYHHGQLRLSRLNWAVRIFQPRSASTAWFYEIPHWSTRPYMERAIALMVFVFASLSLALSSMQIVLRVSADGLGFTHLDMSKLQAIRDTFWVFSIIVLVASGVTWTLILVVPSGVVGWQLLWGFRNRRKAVVARAAEA